MIVNQCCIVTKQKYFVTVLKQFFWISVLHYLYFCLLLLYYILLRKLILLLRYISPETFVTRYKIKSSLEKCFCMRAMSPTSGTVVEHMYLAVSPQDWSISLVGDGGLVSDLLIYLYMVYVRLKQFTSYHKSNETISVVDRSPASQCRGSVELTVVDLEMLLI